MVSDVAKDNGFLRMMKIVSMILFKGEVKLAVPCKILWHVTDSYSMKFTDIPC
jgi:hypothetical protein